VFVRVVSRAYVLVGESALAHVKVRDRCVPERAFATFRVFVWVSAGLCTCVSTCACVIVRARVSERALCACVRVRWVRT